MVNKHDKLTLEYYRKIYNLIDKEEILSYANDIVDSIMCNMKCEREKLFKLILRSLFLSRNIKITSNTKGMFRSLKKFKNPMIKFIEESYKSESIEIPIVLYTIVFGIFKIIHLYNYIRVFIDTQFYILKNSVPSQILFILSSNNDKKQFEKLINKHSVQLYNYKFNSEDVEGLYYINDSLLVETFMSFYYPEIHRNEIIDYYINNGIDKTLEYFNCKEYRTLNDILALSIVYGDIELMKNSKNHEEYILNKYNLLTFVPYDELGYDSLLNYVVTQNFFTGNVITFHKERNFNNEDNCYFLNINDKEQCPLVMSVRSGDEYKGYDVYSISQIIKNYGDNLVTLPLTYIDGKISYLALGTWYFIPQLNTIPQTKEIKTILKFINRNSGIIDDFCCRSTHPIDINKYLLYNIGVFKTQKYCDFTIYLLLMSYFIKGWNGETFNNGDTCSFKVSIRQLNEVKGFNDVKDEHYDIKIQCIYQHIKDKITFTDEEIYYIKKLKLFKILDKKIYYLSDSYNLFSVLEQTFREDDPFCEKELSNYLTDTFTNYVL